MERLQKARNHACDMWQGVWINNRPENWRLQACDWVSEHVGSWYEETSWKPKVALFIFSTMFAACLGMNFFIMVLLPFGWILESVVRNNLMSL
jgi:hypothetical protein